MWFTKSEKMCHSDNVAGVTCYQTSELVLTVGQGLYLTVSKTVATDYLVFFTHPTGKVGYQNRSSDGFLIDQFSSNSLPPHWAWGQSPIQI